MPSSSLPAHTTLTEEHIFFCFDVLNAKLTQTKLPKGIQVPSGDEEFPLFVTWNIASSSISKSTRLRGCIGTFQAMPLQQGLEEYTVIAAFRDHRFNPITQSEMPRLECAISLLTQFEECENYLDWEIGKHGIYIHLALPGRTNTLTATYLPEVASEQGWSKIEAIDSAIQKAGYNGHVTEDMRKGLRVRRYQSEKASARYDDWQKARKG